MGLRSWLAGTSLAKFIVAPFSWTVANNGLEGELVAAYFTGVKILSENIAKMHPQVMDENNRIITKHYLNNLFTNQPNNYLNRQKYWKMKESKRINQGDSYSYIQRGENGKAIGLHLLNYESVTGATLAESGTLYYDVDFGKTPMVPFIGIKKVRGEDIIHMSFGQIEGLFGTRALDILEMQTNILSKALQTLDSFYSNNATSSMAIETTVDRASMANKSNEAADDFIDKYVGSENAGKPIRLPPNTKIVPIGQKFADAQLIETQRFAREEVANLFGIPKSMFEATDNNESIEQQTRMFLALTITPILEAYIAELEFKLLTAEEKAKGVHIEYNTEKLIETDLKTQVDMVVQLVTKGIMSPNKGAIKLGMEPSPSPWADELWIQSQNNPISQYENWGNNDLGNSNNKNPKNEAGDNKSKGNNDIPK